LFQQASDGYEESLGANHPLMLTPLRGLAFVLERQTKYKAAETVRRRVLEVCEKVNGPTHIDTLGAVYDLAWVLHMQNQYDQASMLYRRARSGLRRKLGPHRALSFNCSKGLAALMADNPVLWVSMPSYRFRRLLRSLIVSKAGEGRYLANLSSLVPYS
jgi:hypothetical protein